MIPGMQVRQQGSLQACSTGFPCRSSAAADHADCPWFSSMLLTCSCCTKVGLARGEREELEQALLFWEQS
jgi:hypothetical protein